MAERSDRAPLLDWEETPPPDPNQTGPPAAAAGPRWNSGGTGGTCSPRSDGRFPGSSAPEVRDRPEPPGPELGDLPDVTVPGQWEEKDQVVAVFVVTFDTRSGNMVEWCRPHDVDLDGVEFKSMASGSHRVTADFIYFRKAGYFGLACFANMAVESELERGARMKSVGILSPSYTLLYRYMNFLENQVRLQLQSPGHYSPLEAFYEDKKAELPPTGSGVLTSWSRCLQPEMKITHPAGCMSQFVQFFGDQIFVLWKFTLLRKRLLFLSPPPVGVVCYRVYCCCCLANVSLPGVSVSAPELRPFFYVNVADIAALETETSYVACTTEKIFEEKKQLYDVYIDNQNVKTHKRHLQPLLKINQTDRDKYRRLTEQRQALLYSQELDSDSCSSSEEDLFILFFMDLNNRIFQTLSEVAASSDPMLTVDRIRSMGLDPQDDRCFLSDLIDVYGFDVTLVVDNLCCF